MSYTVASRELVRQVPAHGGDKTPLLFRVSPNTPYPAITYIPESCAHLTYVSVFAISAPADD